MGVPIHEAISYEPLKWLLLDVAQLPSLDAILRTVVVRLSEYPHFVLARIWALGRIWLVSPGPICGTCPTRSQCPDRRRSLHRVASSGRSVAGVTEWSRLDNRFQRFPVWVQKVGRIAARLAAIEVPDSDGDRHWVRRI
ncbi:MAG TPA: hypothetical protein VMR25_07360 [Planctomycetaceae bacterium]|jgi:hypothetical protein|nr:hypothetical protein [Planctomycetaceae bacterium]